MGLPRATASLAALAASACAVLGAAGAHGAPAPGCLSGGAPGPPAGGVVAGRVALPGPAVAALSTPDGQSTFASLAAAPEPGLLGSLLGEHRSGGLAVLSGESPRATLSRTVQVPGEPGGLALSPDGAVLLLADGSGVLALDPHALRTGAPATLGALGDGRDGQSTLALSPGGHFLFVGGPGGVTVYNLLSARAAHFDGVHPVGHLELPGTVSALDVSPDGRTLLAVGGTGAAEPGWLAAIDALGAEQSPAGAVVHRVPAGCGPSAVSASPDASTAWVTASGSGALLAWPLTALAAGSAVDPSASVGVGPEPSGLALLDGGGLALVADHGGAAATVIDTEAALAHTGPAVLGSLATAAAPTGIATTPDGVFATVAAADGQALDLIDAASLPEGAGDVAVAVARMVVSVQPRRLRAGRGTRLTIRVTDARGAPIAGAAVHLGHQLAHTGHAGMAHLSAHPRRPGTLRVVGTSRGYASVAVSVSVARR